VVVSQASTDPQPCPRNAGKGTLKVDGAIIESAVNWPVPLVAKASASERANCANQSTALCATVGCR
jgi:hypothetical protein